MDELRTRLDCALRLAREAGEITLRYFRRENYEVELKSDASPVTIADREAEAFLREAIRAEFPDDAVLGEELGELPGGSGFRWILDPIDGTKSFVCGVPLYGMLIGVERNGRSDVGVIYIPALDEGAYAMRGGGAWQFSGMNPARPARVADKAELGKSIFCTSEVKTYLQRGRGEAFDSLQSAAWVTRTWGDCYGYLLVATGRADVMVDPLMSVWDCAALQPIIEEAGGAFTDWSGKATIHGEESIACNPALLPQVLEITRPFAGRSG